MVVSYFLAREARVGRGLLMGLQIAIFHVLSAMVVVALADLLLRRAFGGAPAEVAGVRLFSYGLIALIGAVMLAQAVRRSQQRRAGIEVDGCCGRSRRPRIVTGRGTRASRRSRALCRSASAWCRARARC